MQESEIQRLEFLLLSGPVVIYSLKPQGDELKSSWVSDNIRDRFGYTVEEALEPDWWYNNLHPEDREKALGHSSAILEQDKVQHEYRFRHANGGYRYIADKIQIIRDANGNISEVIGTWTDISNLKQAENALHLQARIMDQIRDAVVSTDLDGLITSWNQGAEKMFGYMGGDIIGKHVSVLYPVEDRGFLRDGIIVPLQTQGEYETDATMLCQSGETFAAHLSLSLLNDEDDRAIGMIGYVMDISKRKQVEAALKDQQVKLQGLYDLSPLGIALTDMDGHFVDFNKAFEKICAYPAEELKHLDYWTLTPRQYEALEQKQLSLLSKTGRYGPYEKEYRQKNGHLIPVRLNGMLVTNNAGESYIWSIVENITESKRFEQVLTAARDEAERANRAKSDFLSNMSHELRTPMNAILGFAQLMDITGNLPDKQNRYVKEILKAGDHLLALINDILDLSKIESGKIDVSLEPVNIWPSIEECLDLIGALAAKRNIPLSYEGTKNAVLCVDQTRFKQAFLNLLSNAVKYNHDGGRIKVTGMETDNNQFRLQITDTGTGIPAERMDELFQPFNRLGAEKTGIEGTGIGLALTLRIVELMGGTMGVESEPGSGSTFWLEFPLELLDKPEISPAAPGQLESRDNDKAQHTLLYIKDNPASLKLVTQILELHRHIRLITAHTLELGIELAKAHQPGLILLDINLSGTDVYKVPEIFRDDAELKDIPVVAVTADAVPQDAGDEAGGFYGYLAEPLEVAKFNQMIDQIFKN